MERAEKQGLAVAGVGHLLLFAALSLGLFSARIPKPPLSDPMDVTIADTVGMRSAAPVVSQAAPKASEAPAQGAPEDAAPPLPTPEPAPEPKPAPPEPKPTPPKPKPAPEKPTPPKPEPKPVPKPAPAKPEKKPEPKPDKPKPEKAKPAPEKPAKPTPEKTSPAKATPARSNAKPTTSKKATGLPSDFLSDLPKDPGTGKTGTAAKAKGSRLGKDFLKGIGSDAAGKADAPRAAVSGRSMAGLAGLLLQQVKPCYNPPAGGADAAAIATVLNLRMNRDGSVASVTIGEQSGVNGQNGAYARQMADAARRAVLRCAPFKLPADLYEGGWDDFGFRFRPGL